MTIDPQVYLNDLGQEMVILAYNTAKYDGNMDRYAFFVRRRLRLATVYFEIISNYLNARVYLSTADVETVMRKINNLLGTSLWYTIP